MLPLIANKKLTRILPTTEYILNFDGCSKGNPGKAGCGAVIYQNGTEIWAGYLYNGQATNNFAEYSGLILGLRQAKTMEIGKIKVLGDSLLVIQQMNNVFQCRSPNLINLHQCARELASSFAHIQFVHVFRNQNKRADELSNIAVELEETNKRVLHNN
jgi:ribonuclease HI